MKKNRLTLLIFIIILIGAILECNAQHHIADRYKDITLYNLSDSSELEIFYMAEEYRDTISGEWMPHPASYTVGSITFKKDMSIVSGQFNNWKEWEFQHISETQYVITEKMKQYQTPVVWPNNDIGVFVISTGFWKSSNEKIEIPEDAMAFESVILDINKTRRFIFLGLIAK